MLPKIFFASALLAACVPMVGGQVHAPATPLHFPGWPTHFQGREIIQLPLEGKELRLASDFPGKIGRFWDGEREIIIRWVAKETRRLHPIADCLRGSGFQVQPAPILLDADGNRWGCVRAGVEGDSRLVCERIYDNAGNSWSDVSGWFWSALLGKTKGPWFSVAAEWPHQRGTT
ncbi:MAG: hypothetical protein J5J00_03585 [Deltaproteobacteria bacterium]|nr:hypothetical protein [Deltaproteobacteria bacterium]